MVSLRGLFCCSSCSFHSLPHPVVIRSCSESSLMCTTSSKQVFFSLFTLFAAMLTTSACLTLSNTMLRVLVAINSSYACFCLGGRVVFPSSWRFAMRSSHLAAVVRHFKTALSIEPPHPKWKWNGF